MHRADTSRAMTFVHSISALLITSLVAVVGFAHLGHAPATGNAGAFGGPVAHVQMHPLYREPAHPASGSLRQVRCDAPTAARCFEATSPR